MVIAAVLILVRRDTEWRKELCFTALCKYLFTQLSSFSFTKLFKISKHGKNFTCYFQEGPEQQDLGPSSGRCKSSVVRCLKWWYRIRPLSFQPFEISVSTVNEEDCLQDGVYRFTVTSLGTYHGFPIQDKKRFTSTHLANGRQNDMFCRHLVKGIVVLWAYNFWRPEV